MRNRTNAAYNFIPTIMYTQIFNVLVYIADNEHKGRLPVHVRCLLDEFPNIGRIPNFETLIATIRSREISVAVIVQTYSQLKDAYKDSADTIIGNCDVNLFLGGTEKGTLEHLSATLGKETIDVASGGKGGASYSKQGRELMTPDEIATMDGGLCLLRIRGEHPFRSKKYDLTKHPNYKLTSDADERLRYDPRSHPRIRARAEAEARKHE